VKEENKTRANAAWETFSQTGKVGAYLAYRAILAGEDRGEQDR